MAIPTIFTTSCFLLVMATGLPGQEPQAEDAKQPERAIELHQASPETFRENSEAQQKINFEKIDQALLSAAIFHETNRRRTQHELPALTFQPELREAARIQSRGMRQTEKVSHQHPDKDKKEVADRLELVGLKGRYFAENVAMVFGIQYDPGQPFYSRIEEGKQILSSEPEGPPIPPHTYLSFADNLLDSWMDSPGHRKNILAEEAEKLGTAALHDRPDDGMDRFYCTQVFFTPLKEERE